MRVRQLLNVNVAALAVLGALVLGMGQRSVALPLAALAAAIASVWLTDATGRFRLNRTAVNLAVVLAGAISAWRFTQARGTLDLTILAGLLVWLQIILLFEKKNLRTWWDLVTLSVLAVLVSTGYEQGVLFGVALAAYLFVGLAVLALMLLYRERLHYDHAGPRPGADRSLAIDWGRLGKIALATVVLGPVSLFLRYKEPSGSRRGRGRKASPAPGARRWPLAGRRPQLAGSAPGPADPTGVDWEFWVRLGAVALATLVWTLVVFLVTPRFGRVDFAFPRFGRGAWDSTDDAPTRAVGFSDEVSLGEPGKTIEDREEVLKIQFVEHATGQPYEVKGEIYLRGAVLTEYRDGTWEYGGPMRAPRLRLLKRAEVPPGDGLVRQEITIEPMGRGELFCVWPFVAIEEDGRLWFDARQERLHRLHGLRNNRFSFRLGTTAFVDGTQSALAPSGRAVDSAPLLQMPPEGLPELVALADQWVAESTVPADDCLNRARLLEARLLSSDRFEYTLEGPVRDGALDPIEDFIRNNPRGHCEYFATALALMLRSQGIPARMVVGYKCNDYNGLGRFYQVRQLHAHAWVEAYLGPERLPSELPRVSRLWDWSAGAWLRLDPTPSSSGFGTGAGGFVSGVQDWLQRLNYRWTYYVTSMNGSRQREEIYEPIVAWAKGWGRRAADLGWWRGLLGSVGQAGDPRHWQWPGGRRFVWQDGLAAALGAVVLALAYWGLRRVFRRWSLHPAAGGTLAARGDRAGVGGFYRRMEALLARHGLTRPASQTQREFARQAGARLAEWTGEEDLADLPAQVAEAFYRLRFGGGNLPDQQAQAVAHALERLRACLNGQYCTARLARPE